VLFFTLNSLVLGIILTAIVFGATILGLWVGHRLRSRGDVHRESLSVLQGTMLGVVGLLLAFGLALAVGRYETRLLANVNDANAIGTAYLRAQTIAEPMRSESMRLMVDYTDAEILLATSVPGSAEAAAAADTGSALAQQLWTQAGRALAGDPTGSATRLYVESLNDMIDQQTVHVAALGNRVPSTVLFLEVLAAGAALGFLAAYLALLGRGIIPVLIGAGLVTALLFVTFDLDRPTRGLINVEPTALIAQRQAMDLPPAVEAPN
jgi:hypothetical protein